MGKRIVVNGCDNWNGQAITEELFQERFAALYSAQLAQEQIVESLEQLKLFGYIQIVETAETIFISVPAGTYKMMTGG